MRRYAVLPRLAGGWFLLVGALARLPVAMAPIGVMLLVTSTTGSVALGGLATGAASLGTAGLAPVQGRLADRFGQRPVLLVATAMSSASLVAVTAAAVQGWALPVLLLVCIAAGGTAPQVGPLARVRWLTLTAARPGSMNVAMSWESTVDELTFVLGPALVGMIASVRPEATLPVAAGIVAVFGTWFAVHPTAPPAGTRHPSGQHPAAPGVFAVLRVVLAPTLGMVALGTFFGSSQAAVTGVATALGQPGSAGLLLAVMGIGSAVTALAVVALPRSIGPRWRWLVGGVGMAVVMVAALGVRTTGSTALALLVAGLFVGPAIVTLFSVCGDSTPTGSASTAMTLMVSANVVGVAVGAAVGGQVVEALQQAGGAPGLAFAVPAAASALLALTSLLHRDPPQADREGAEVPRDERVLTGPPAT